MNIVTNMLESLPRHEASLMACMMRAGLFSWAEKARNMECITLITIADGTPLPLTSPMQKKSFSSRMK